MIILIYFNYQKRKKLTYPHLIQDLSDCEVVLRLSLNMKCFIVEKTLCNIRDLNKNIIKLFCLYVSADK